MYFFSIPKKKQSSFERCMIFLLLLMNLCFIYVLCVSYVIGSGFHSSDLCFHSKLFFHSRVYISVVLLSDGHVALQKWRRFKRV